jgi:hypothetical protein
MEQNWAYALTYNKLLKQALDKVNPILKEALPLQLTICT